MCNIGVTEGKIENLKKEGKMRISIFIFIYTIHFAYLKVNDAILESPPQFENRIMAQVYIRIITRSTMYQKAPFC